MIRLPIIGRFVDLKCELTGARWHPRQQQESAWGIVLRFLGWPCECETPEVGGCVYPGLGWRCGHLRRGHAASPSCPRCGHRSER